MIHGTHTCASRKAATLSDDKSRGISEYFILAIIFLAFSFFFLLLRKLQSSSPGKNLITLHHRSGTVEISLKKKREKSTQKLNR